MIHQSNMKNGLQYTACHKEEILQPYGQCTPNLRSKAALCLSRALYLTLYEATEQQKERMSKFYYQTFKRIPVCNTWS